ncbi:Valine N-monooxygenase 1, partial [Linum grandiflorum]
YINQAMAINTSNPMINFIVLLLVLVFSTIISIIVVVTKRSSKPTAKLPPSPPSSWPVIGNIREIMFRKKPATFRWIHRVMKEMNTEICLIRVGGTNIVPVLDPAIAREMLKKQDAIFSGRPAFTVGSHVISGGLYRASVVAPFCDDNWRKLRKVFTSEILSPARHRWLKEKRDEEADNLVFYIHNHSGAHKTVNLRVATRHYCGNVIRKMMFSQRFFGEPTVDGGPGPKEIEHVEAVLGALKYVYSYSVSNIFPFLRWLDLDGQGKLIKKANKTITDYQNPIIDERIRQWRSGERKEMEDLTDVFITLEDVDGNPSFSRDEITYEAVEIMLAAVDNPSNVVEWTMAELIKKPELLANATAEIDRVVGKDRLVQESDILSLNYVKACARESFRLHPVSAFNVPHVAVEDTIVAGYLIPKGSHALLSRYGLGRNPKVWSDPLKFDPERHLHDGVGEVVLTEHDLTFLSFSTGRRGCVAAQLGTCVTTMLLARLIQCFAWAPLNGVKTIDLEEAEDNLALVSPLIASATPRLAKHMYLFNQVDLL